MPTTSHRYLNLERRASRLRRQLAQLAGQRRPGGLVDPLDVAAASELVQIDHALMRLNQGRGDVCEICKQPIGADRLASLPYTTLCASCMSAAAHRPMAARTESPVAVILPSR